MGKKETFFLPLSTVFLLKLISKVGKRFEKRGGGERRFGSNTDEIKVGRQGVFNCLDYFYSYYRPVREFVV